MILYGSPNEFAKSKRVMVALFLNCHRSKIFKLVYDGFDLKVLNNGLAGPQG